MKNTVMVGVITGLFFSAKSPTIKHEIKLLTNNDIANFYYHPMLELDDD